MAERHSVIATDPQAAKRAVRRRNQGTEASTA